MAGSSPYRQCMRGRQVVLAPERCAVEGLYRVAVRNMLYAAVVGSDKLRLELRRVWHDANSHDDYYRR